MDTFVIKFKFFMLYMELAYVCKGGGGVNKCQVAYLSL